MAEAGDMLDCMPGRTERLAAEFLLRPGKLASCDMHLEGATLQPIVTMTDCLLQARHARALSENR